MTDRIKTDKSQTLGLAWLIWGLAAAFYFSDYMARVAPSVMHKYLQIDFGMNEEAFGILTASFYIPYILMQIPVGLMVDRSSIRGLLTVMSIVTALGCFVFGLSDGLVMASLGRMLIGFSAAFAFISSLRLATSWFPPTMLGLLAGLTQALGMLGAAAGEAPVSFLVSAVGWRHSMLVMGFMFIVLSGLLYQFIRDNPMAGRQHKPVPQMGIFRSLRVVLSSGQTWINALYAGCLFGPTAVIGEAIGPAYLQFGRGLGAHEAAFAIGLIFIGWGIGGPLTGWWSDTLGRRKPLMMASAVFGILLTTVLVYAPNLSATQFYALLFLFGLTNTGVGLSYAVSTELHHRMVVGTSIAFTNMASIFVGASLQPMVGKMVDAVAGSRSYNVDLLQLSDFQSGLQLLPVCSFVALILSLCIRETHCKNLTAQDSNQF